MPNFSRYLALAAVAALALAAPADAIPIFAHEYGVTCQKCHSQVPRLNEFGAHFAANGYRIAGVTPGPAAPVAVRFNLVASSERQGDGPDGNGLPKAIVDEIELFTAGTIGSRANYFVEQYVVDGGQHGLIRDAWVNERLTPWSGVPANLQIGSFTLPLPVDPETFRDSATHYSVFDQTVGDDPFAFFDPKVGVKLSVGDTLRGISIQLFAGPGHDRRSGLQTTGTDLMGYVQHVAGPFALSAYRYQGTRPGGDALDRFVRTGFGLVYAQARWTSESVLQTGSDSSCDPGACASSGGFTQLRYAIGPRLFAEARYQGTDDPTNGFTRDGVVLLGYRPTHNARITVEDAIAHAPSATHTLNVQYTIAY
jgi:hypothetical protein